MTRKQILGAVKKSRQASKKLAQILLDPHCCVGQVGQLLEQGALVEEAVSLSKEKNSSRTINIQAIAPVVDHDRGDILALLYKAGSLEKGLTDDWMGDAISQGAKSCVGALIEAGEIRKQKSRHGEWLTRAAQKGDGDVLRLLIEGGVDPNSRFVQKDVGSVGDYTSCALHWACNAQTVDVLLDAGADIDARNQHGYPPVHAILDRVAFLGTCGTDVQKRNGFVRAACALVEKGAGLTLPPDEKGQDWDIFGPMNSMRDECGEIVRALKKRRDFDVEKWVGRVKSMNLLFALLENFEEIEAGKWARKGFWEGVYVGNDEARKRAVELIVLGVKPPKIQDVLEDMNAWLRIGIPVEEEDLARAQDKFYEQYNPEEDYVEWEDPEPELVAKSNAIALARLAQGRRETIGRGKPGEAQTGKVAKPKI